MSTELWMVTNLGRGAAHCSPWCKKRGGFWRSNFKKWETLRSSFHKLRTSLFHCRVQNRGPESARDLFSLTQDFTFFNYWHRNRGPEFTHAFFSTLNGTKEANTSLMPFLYSRLKIPQWKESRISNNKKHFGMLRLHVYPTISDEFESTTFIQQWKAFHNALSSCVYYAESFERYIWILNRINNIQKHFRMPYLNV